MALARVLQGARAGCAATGTENAVSFAAMANRKAKGRRVAETDRERQVSAQGCVSELVSVLVWMGVALAVAVFAALVLDDEGRVVAFLESLIRFRQ